MQPGKLFPLDYASEERGAFDDDSTLVEGDQNRGKGNLPCSLHFKMPEVPVSRELFAAIFGKIGQFRLLVEPTG